MGTHRTRLTRSPVRRYAAGGPALLRELDATVAAEWHVRRKDSSAVLHVPRLADGGKAEALGAYALEDEIRPEARQAIAQLREQGVRKIVMIAGDARPIAEAVVVDLSFRPGVSEVFAEVLPAADKNRAVADLLQRGLAVAMVGGGVDDAPARTWRSGPPACRPGAGIALSPAIGGGADVRLDDCRCGQRAASAPGAVAAGAPVGHQCAADIVVGTLHAC